MSLRALLFCPDEKTAKVVSQVLADVDFSVDLTGEPFAAVKKLSSLSFDALVVDCVNEQNAGLLMKSARNSSANQGSLIVALVEGQIGVANAFRIGANLVLTKPVAVEQARSTLRVARGLLRKSSDAAAATPASAKAAAPVADPGPTPAPWPVQPAPPPPAPRTAPMLAPAQLLPSAAPAAAISSSLESEAERAPAPDAAEAGLLESMGSGSSFNNTTQVTELAASNVSPDLAKQFRAVAMPEHSAAAAPARAVSAPAASAAPVRERENSESTGGPVVYPDFPDLHPKENTEVHRKAPLVAVVAILFVAAAFYFGWSMLRGNSKPVQKPPEVAASSAPATFATFDPPAPATSATSSAPAKTAPAPEAITKFVVPGDAAAGASARTPGNEARSSATAAGKTPLQVQTEKRLEHADTDATDTAPAPPLGTLANNGADSALSTLVASTPASLPTSAQQAVRISQGVSQGLLLKRVQPVYPAQARQARIEGAVEVLATIAKDGSIKDVKVVSGAPILGKVAADAVRQWKYKPYYLNGDAVEVQTQIMLNFKLPN